MSKGVDELNWYRRYGGSDLRWMMMMQSLFVPLPAVPLFFFAPKLPCCALNFLRTNNPAVPLFFLALVTLLCP